MKTISNRKIGSLCEKRQGKRELLYNRIIISWKRKQWKQKAAEERVWRMNASHLWYCVFVRHPLSTNKQTDDRRQNETQKHRTEDIKQAQWYFIPLSLFIVPSLMHVQQAHHLLRKKYKKSQRNTPPQTQEKERTGNRKKERKKSKESRQAKSSERIEKKTIKSMGTNKRQLDEKNWFGVKGKIKEKRNE